VSRVSFLRFRVSVVTADLMGMLWVVCVGAEKKSSVHLVRDFQLVGFVDHRLSELGRHMARDCKGIFLNGSRADLLTRASETLIGRAILKRLLHRSTTQNIAHTWSCQGLEIVYTLMVASQNLHYVLIGHAVVQIFYWNKNQRQRQKEEEALTH
jgi:hypothetical protein